METNNFFSHGQLSIGNIDIDEDHYRLLEIINDLNNLIQFGKDREEFARILSLMTDYSLTHFKLEELYMKEFNYPKLDAHKKSHFKYIYIVSNYNVALLGINPPDPREIVDFLKNWWENHILKMDSSYENYRKEIKSVATYRKTSI